MKILFLSTKNIMRSIMAESIMRKYEGLGIKAMSGGSHSEEDIHPVVFRILKNLRYSSTDLVSKSWDTFENWEPDVVVTLCDKLLKQKCPAYVGKAIHVHWGIDDPEKKFGNMEESFTKTFVTLDDRIKALIAAKFHEMDKIELRAELKRVVQ
ncbi:MAG: hypothetical protein P8J14_06920 [Emcibacteraceae bacterium]|nr:hypothetical protein [Emcibacteraceae bacterium]